MENNDALTLLNVQKIIDEGYSFFVPKYQRGYRWTEEQATRLMQDLLDFERAEGGKSKEERCPFYSMQVLVVEERENNVFEVIDGQQRLTTMLILRQAYHIANKIKNSDFVDIVIESGKGLIPNQMYQIRYETREGSEKWLKELTLAYLKDYHGGKSSYIENFQLKNRDYHHFAEVLMAGIKQIELNPSFNWDSVLNQTARFIWYDKSKVQYEDANELIFNRLNATKIKLNNAELIKALFLQEGVYNKEGLIRRDQMAIEWDELEQKLQDPEFWMFICSSKQATSYSTHIEYLFDILQGKTEEQKDRENYTFDRYYDQYQKAPDKYNFVQAEWEKVMDMYRVLQEWYNDRHFFHLTGYLLEYGKYKNEKNEEKDLTIPQLISKLYTDETKNEIIRKSEWLDTLKRLVKDSLANISSYQLVYHNPQMTQILFLFNILQEDKRKNPNARFSFNRYKRIALGLDDGIVWHQEHVASHSDYTPDLDKRQELARDLLEYFTGIDIPISEIKQDIKLSFVDEYNNGINKLPKKEKVLCERLIQLFNQLPAEEKPKEEEEKKLMDIFSAVNKYFEADDPLKEDISYKNGKKSEKDFIWNFVLLNSKTNMSYGNSIFPVKRKRILKDEGDIFTLFGTRNIFDKTYSKRLSNLMSWGHHDAFDYWCEIVNTLQDYLPNNFRLPEYIKI